MKINRLILIFAIFMSAMCFSNLDVNARSTKVIYQADEYYPPYTFTNNDYLYGFDPDLANLIFNKNDYDVAYSYDTWSNVYKKVENGQVDIGGIGAILDERKGKVLFTEPLYTSYISVYTKNTFQKINLKELSKYKVAVGRGYYTKSILKDKLGVNNFIPYDNIEDAIQDLEDDKIDVIFENQQVMNYLLAHKNLKGSISPQITDLFPVDQAYIINKNKPELVDYMNKRIDELKNSGAYEQLYKKYFYTNSEDYVKQRNKTIVYLVVIVLAIIAVILILLNVYIDRLKASLSKNYGELTDVNKELSITKANLEQQYAELYKNQKALKESEERYRLVLESSNDGIWDWDIVNDVCFLSKSWLDLFGIQDEKIEDFTNFFKKVVFDDDREKIIQKFKTYLTGTNTSCEEIYRLKFHNEDGFIWVYCKGVALKDNSGSLVRMTGSISDITELKNYETKIYKMAYYDSLTDLPNRTFLNDKLESIIEYINANEGKAAVYFLDLDNFKTINDTLGHDYGDLVLKNAGNKILEILDNNYTVARFGGDEFVILQHKVLNEEELVKTAQKIIKLFEEPIIVDNESFYVAVSIGAAIIPEHGTDSVEILKKADIAMYNAKEEGKGRFKIYDEEMVRKVELESDFEKSIIKAINQKEFYLNYQPFYDVNTGEIKGIEALIRWNHPKKGIIAPSDFIPLAEKKGLIKEIGDWVLLEACKQNKLWQDNGLKKIPIAVNVSEHQFQSPLFIEKVMKALEESKLEPQYLKIEITEGTVIKSFDHNIDILKKLRQLGIGISLDDFGTGYSSLSYIIKLPLDTVKIDKSFVDDICNDANRQIIIEDIISLAHKLNLEVIAEGVESDLQLNYLKEHNCDKVQGYLLSKPLSSEKIIETL